MTIHHHLWSIRTYLALRSALHQVFALVPGELAALISTIILDPSPLVHQCSGWKTAEGAPLETIEGNIALPRSALRLSESLCLLAREEFDIQWWGACCLPPSQWATLTSGRRPSSQRTQDRLTEKHVQNQVARPPRPPEPPRRIWPVRREAGLAITRRRRTCETSQVGRPEPLGLHCKAASAGRFSVSLLRMDTRNITGLRPPCRRYEPSWVLFLPSCPTATLDAGARQFFNGSAGGCFTTSRLNPSAGQASRGCRGLGSPQERSYLRRCYSTGLYGHAYACNSIPPVDTAIVTSSVPFHLRSCRSLRQVEALEHELPPSLWAGGEGGGGIVLPGGLL